MAKRPNRKMREAAKRYRESSGSHEVEPRDAPLENTMGTQSSGLQPVTEIPCPDCAETIKAAAKVCRFCGAKVRGSKRSRPARGKRPRRTSGRITGPQKEPGIAAILSVFVPGLGHVYAGQLAIGLGILFLLPCLTLCLYVGLGVALLDGSSNDAAGFLAWQLVFAMVSLVLYVGQIVLAYQAASSHNARGGRFR